MKSVCLVFFAAFALAASVTTAQTDTTFTYPGELQENGSPANGSFNMAFVLFDSEVGGSQVSSVAVGGGGVGGNIIYGHATNLQYGTGVAGVADGTLAATVTGFASSPTGQSFGVYGTASSTTGIGVRVEAVKELRHEDH